nr:ATP-binding protein [Thermoanaerobacterium thermosaccharolyticum]
MVIILAKKVNYKSIQWKIILIYGLLILVAMEIIWVYLFKSLENYHMTNFENYIEAQATGIAFTLKDNMNSKSSLDNIINMYLGPNAYIKYVYILDKDGNILASSTGEKGKMLTPAVIKALSGKQGMETSNDNNSNGKIRSIAMPVVDSDGKISGVVYVSGSLKSVYDTLSDVNFILLSATFIAVIITVILGYILAKTITDPIKEVTKYAREMAEGNFDVHIDIKSDDEIGKLGSMFNFMSKRLKSTLNEMENEKSKVEAIISYMSDGVIATNDLNRVILFNNAAERMIGEKITMDEPLEKIAQGQLKNTESLIYCNGKILKSFVSPIKVDKNIDGNVFVLHDITEQQNLDNMRKEFVANVSHELRTPLTTIKSYTETLLNDGVDEEYRNRFLSIIDKEVDRMTRLVKDLLLLSKMDSNGKLNLEETNLNEFIENILYKIKIEAQKKNQKLTFCAGEEKRNINIDRDKMEQVLLNVVSNAIKYTNLGGYVRVFTKYDDDYAYITISDNGIGIPKKDLPRIFERFYRVDKGRSRELGGTGLGLAIAKEIVTAHGGEINIESEVGIGTTVYIKLKY